MTVKEIRQIAQKLQIKNAGKLKKAELIRAIQLAEGNNDCYQKIADCGQMDCSWRGDCQ